MPPEKPRRPGSGTSTTGDRPSAEYSLRGAKHDEITVPDLPPLRRRVDTLVDGGHLSAPLPLPMRGARPVPAPPREDYRRKDSPPPVSGSPLSIPPDGARVRVGPVDVRVGGGAFKKFIPWVAPFVLSALGTVGGAIVGYYQGLAKAAADVAELREAVKQNGLSDVQRSAQVSGDLDRVFLLVRQAQRDIKTLQEEANVLKDATPKIQGLPPK